jgi:hypothetical protein
MPDEAHPITPLALAVIGLASAMVGDERTAAPDAATAFLMGVEMALVIGRDHPDVAARVLAYLAAGDGPAVTDQRDHVVATFANHVRHHT